MDCFIKREYEYHYEDVKKCNYCNHYIQFKFCKISVNKTNYYYHKDCFHLVVEKLKKF